MSLVIPKPTMAAIQTPCEKICVVDHASARCLGCGRSLDEIGSWTAYSDAERARIMAELPGRLRAMQPCLAAGSTDRNRKTADE